MQLIDPAAASYAERYTSEEDALLKEVAAFTEMHHPKAHMLSGHLQGAFLSMISWIMQPKRILEIGTFTGYSALCLAKGLIADGKLHTIELREEDAATARGFFERSFNKERLVLHIGEARDIIDELEEVWDLVFIDADKVGYTDYFNRIFPKVRSGGLILADNVLFHGQVLSSEAKGKNPAAIQSFNDMIAQRNDVEKVFLPLRDGLYLIRKL